MIRSPLSLLPFPGVYCNHFYVKVSQPCSCTSAASLILLRHYLRSAMKLSVLQWPGQYHETELQRKSPPHKADSTLQHLWNKTFLSGTICSVTSVSDPGQDFQTWWICQASSVLRSYISLLKYITCTSSRGKMALNLPFMYQKLYTSILTDIQTIQKCSFAEGRQEDCLPKRNNWYRSCNKHLSKEKMNKQTKQQNFSAELYRTTLICSHVSVSGVSNQQLNGT